MTKLDDKIVQRFYLHNAVVKENKSGILTIEAGTIVYEVFRTVSGIALFIEDHFERLAHSVKSVNPIIDIDNLLGLFYSDIQKLIADNDFAEGNIKIVMAFNENCVNRYVYYLPHVYPTTQMYDKGVHMVCLNAVRKNPDIKMLHQSIKEQVNKILSDSNIYEVALVNENRITEGSRSNLFFIKGNIVYTAPDNEVLLGITRKYVLKILYDNNIDVVFDCISLNSLPEFDAAFISGTSPKVLPVKSIENYTFSLPNSLLSFISVEYDKLMTDYINKNKLYGK
ncbi:MAG TPA: aminotransferase class IV [Bacteroidales bacterium]|nr:aminotransferase class IV [Bacteroidales bacterium]